MSAKKSSRLDIKLFLMVMVVITLSIIPLVLTFWKAINGYGHKASSIYEHQLYSQIVSSMKTITHKRISSYQAFFDRISASVGLLGRHASTIYSDLEFYAMHPMHDYEYHRMAHNGIWQNAIDDPVVSLYWGGEELGPETANELKALTHMTPLFESSLDQNPEVHASHIISITGVGQYVTNNKESSRGARNLPSPSEFDLRIGQPMTIFTEQIDGLRGVRWTSVYKDDVIDELMLTASAPIYDKIGNFCGIAGIDVLLDIVIDDILKFEMPSADNLVQFSFLLDRTGRLIAFPDKYLKEFGLLFDPNSLTNSADRLETTLQGSTNKNVQEFAHDIVDSEEFFSELDIGQESYYVSTHKLDRLGWVFGIVVSQDAVVAPFAEGRMILEKMIKNLGLKGLVFTILLIFISLCVVFFWVKYLVMPLRTLSVATKRVADGDFGVRCPVNTSDETGVLAASFNTMVERLKMAQERQKRYADSLEVEVYRRNRELMDKKGELEMTIELLKKEIERRQIISEALKNSQQQYYETMEATMAGIFIITDSVFNYVNTPLAEMMQSSSGEMIGLDPMIFVAEEDRERTEENIQKRLMGDNIPPFRIKCVRKDHTVFYGEVWAKVTEWQEKTAIVGTITDVSNVKLNEEKLQVQEVQLRNSLAEKEILLKEIYHRTKNNMLVIISMLELQTSDIDDEKVRAIFQETESRIRAMALVHEKLYRSKNLSEIDLGSYLEEVADSLVANMAMNEKVLLHMDIESMAINIDYAIPLGLIINEIVTNSVKHAFPGKLSGSVFVGLKKGVDGQIILNIGDDGSGLPAEIDVDTCTTFGMQMIYSLIKVQLKGSVALSRENGTSFQITFPEPKSQERI